MARKTNTEEARRIAAGYISPAHVDAEMTRFATVGQANGWELLQCVEHNARRFAREAEYLDEPVRPDVLQDLDYLRTWVREHYGPYALCVEHEVWGETDDEWDDGETTVEHPMFETLNDVAEFLFKNLTDRVEDDVWTVRTLLRSDVSEYYKPGVRGGVAVPVAEAEQYTVSAEHGFTDRTWCWVILSVRMRFERISGR